MKASYINRTPGKTVFYATAPSSCRELQAKAAHSVAADLGHTWLM